MNNTEQANWGKYYERRVMSFAQSYYPCLYAIEKLAKVTPEVNNLDENKVMLLGGFHPGNNTIEAFLEFCKQLHPIEKDAHLVMDMNKYPLVSVISKELDGKIQGRLEEMPFMEKALDLAIFDYTLDFMDDSKVTKFSKEINYSLSENGLLVATIANCLFPSFGKLYGGHVNGVPYYPRTIRGITQRLEDLKPVLIAECEDCRFNLLVFSRKESFIPKHKGEPFSFDFDSPWKKAVNK